MINKENLKLGCAIISAGLIGGLCWKYRRKIINGIAEFVGTAAAIYTEYDYGDLPSYTWVKGHWRFDRYGNMTYVKPHYRVTYKRRRY
jgi:hypothetical protein